jgi:alpha-1,2-mannosyltransferase
VLVALGRLARNRLLLVAALLWCTTFFVVSALLLTGRAPTTLSYRVYAAAGQHWLARQPLYESGTLEGFQYLPQSAMIFAIFAWLGSPTGDLLWRAAGWIGLASGLWRVTAALVPTRHAQSFLVSSALVVGPAIGALTNGQANLALAALSLHVVAALGKRRWWGAALVLAFGVALKPLLLVLALLVWVLHRPVRWRLSLALAVVFLVPWLDAAPSYVADQYTSCLGKMLLSADAGPHYENLRGLLATIGWALPRWLDWPAAFATLGICWHVLRRIREPQASLLIATYAVSYLVLFNPRTQSTSYAMTGSMAALLAVAHASEGRWARSLGFVLSCMLWIVNYNWDGFAFVECWLRPLGALAFLAYVIEDSIWAPAAWQRGHDPTAVSTLGPARPLAPCSSSPKRMVAEAERSLTKRELELHDGTSGNGARDPSSAPVRPRY